MQVIEQKIEDAEKAYVNHCNALEAQHEKNVAELRRQAFELREKMSVEKEKHLENVVEGIVGKIF